MVEDVIDQIGRHGPMSKRRWLAIAAGVVVILVVLGVGLNTIASGLLKGPKAAAGSPAATAVRDGSGAPVAQGVTANGDQLQSITEADFGYLKPANSADWTLDDASETYDAKKGLVKYNLKLTNAGTIVTVSQQALPAQLAPRNSTAFNEFVNNNKPTRSSDAGGGKVYFLPALQNGGVANGADTVIYATDKVLLFGRAERVVGYDGWTKLMSAMKPVF